MRSTAPNDWLVQFSGSFEALSFGRERPDFAPGDPVQITFERLPRT